MTSPRPVVEAENRLEKFNFQRGELLEQVERRVVASRIEAAERREDASLEYVLNDVAFCEMQRLEKNKSKAGQRAFQRWRDLAHRLSRMSDQDKRAELQRLVSHYARDVVGNFNPRVYRFASGVIPPVLSFFFTPVDSLRAGVDALGQFSGRVVVDGPLDLVRDAADRGTLVVTPTHSSNMDSIVLGLGLHLAKLPPCTYGAGKNLFTNPLLSFFMRNLGAYRVDRRLRFGLYKDVLKEYSTVLLENGYHSLFFPGGTRSRSNMVEQKLKLGLLGTAVKAYENNLRNGTAQRRIYVVPVTINYRLVLEAETLIDDFLAAEGQARYIIEDDEFSRIGRIIEFMRKTLALGEAVVLRIGRPLDVFGNDTDDHGESLDRRGRRVDPATYLRGPDGEVASDAQRDAEYTRLLGRRLAAAFHRDTVLSPTQLVARALFDAIAEREGTRDIYRLLRLPPSALIVGVEETRRRTARLCERLADHPQWGRTHGCDRGAREIVDDAVLGLVAYHTRPVASRFNDDIKIGDMKLLYYYQNRTSHIPVEAA